MHKRTLAFLSVAVLLAAGPAARADADLDTFLHGGSTARPLVSTTTSDEGLLAEAADFGTQARSGAVLSGVFDSWWQFVADALLNAPFSTFDFPFTLIIR